MSASSRTRYSEALKCVAQVEAQIAGERLRRPGHSTRIEYTSSGVLDFEPAVTVGIRLHADGTWTIDGEE
jgi:hypothetical protein